MILLPCNVIGVNESEPPNFTKLWLVIREVPHCFLTAYQPTPAIDDDHHGKLGLTVRDVKALVDKCKCLTDVSLAYSGLTQPSIRYICRNVSDGIKRLSFAEEQVFDSEILELVKRCFAIEHLDLRGTRITLAAVKAIITYCSNSMLTLLLPTSIGVELGLLAPKSMGAGMCLQLLRQLGSMPNLIYLSMADYHGHQVRSSEEEIIRAVLESEFPQLSINARTVCHRPVFTDPTFKFAEWNFRSQVYPITGDYKLKALFKPRDDE